jgi:hypothetical protein
MRITKVSRESGYVAQIKSKGALIKWPVLYKST